MIPSHTQLDSKSQSAAAFAKRAELVPLAEIQALAGYVRGGVSPLSTKKPYRLFIDKACEEQQRISVSAGLRGLQILIDPRDLLRVVNARIAPIAR